jgi:predicted AAA+ superfamily ATPase
MLDILTRWNRWGGAKVNAGIEREVTSRLIPFFHTPEVVVLIGPRRAGKTTVLFQVMDALEQTNIPQEAMLHVNLEEPALSPQLSIELLDKIYKTYREEIYPRGKAYLFLDEIQNVPHWEKWIRARNESENIKFFITGSSSQLMSKELGTLLTGRHISFRVFPLNFREFLRFKSIVLPKKLIKASPAVPIQHALNMFLRWGGFPEIVLAENDRRKELLLKQYFDDILFKDVAMRHRIRDTFALRNLAVYLLTHTGSLISLQRIAKVFEVSLDLARSYCQYLQEAFLIDFISFYSRKAAERQRNPQKVYVTDLGLRNAVSLSLSEDKGHVLETLVYHTLQQQDNDGIFYWKRQGEIDFLVRKGITIQTAIQVLAEGLDKQEVMQREVRSFEEAGRLFPHAHQIIIAGKMPQQIPQINHIEIIPLWYFLINNQLNKM